MYITSARVENSNVLSLKSTSDIILSIDVQFCVFIVRDNRDKIRRNSLSFLAFASDNGTQVDVDVGDDADGEVITSFPLVAEEEGEEEGKGEKEEEEEYKEDDFKEDVCNHRLCIPFDEICKANKHPKELMKERKRTILTIVAICMLLAKASSQLTACV